MIQVKILRHSQRLDFSNPFYWAINIGQYWKDSPLTIDGYKMAYDKGVSLISDNFRPKYIYTSPYIRTHCTAIEIQKSFPLCDVVTECLLAEYQPNSCDKVTYYPSGIPTLYHGEQTVFSYPESYESFEKRIRFIISKLVEKNNDDIIIVTHGEVLKTYIDYIQSLYPDLLLDPKNTPYLTTLSFTFDKDNNKIIENSVNISF